MFQVYIRIRGINQYKNKGNKSDCGNYRPVSLTCICDETRSYDSAGGKEGARAATVTDLGHEGEQEKLLSDLDREIEELETSLNEVSSQLKQASLKKEKKQRMDRLDKLRRELFVAEQQLRKTEEEGELKTEKSRKCVTKRSVAKPSKVKTRDSEAKLSTKNC